MYSMFNYRSCYGLEQTAMKKTPLAINLASAGDHEKTTWGWFNTLWSNNVMISLLLSCASVCLCFVCLYICMSTLCNSCVPSAPTVSGGNAIVFIVLRWRRRIIHWHHTLLNLSILPSTHQSNSWAHCLWSHPVISDSTGTGLKIYNISCACSLYKSNLCDSIAPFFVFNFLFLFN